jgi:hypothetical protein
VQTGVDCRESYLRKCSKMVCMNEVTSVRVATALIEMLAGRATREAV